MGIYDRDWYRENSDNSNVYDNRKISKEDAEKIRIMMEGHSNEPPKIDPKYRFEFADNPTVNNKQSSNGYDPTYGGGYGPSSTVKQNDQYKNHRPYKTAPLILSIISLIITFIWTSFMIANNTDGFIASIINCIVFCLGLAASILGIIASFKVIPNKKLNISILIFGIINCSIGNILTGFFIIFVSIILLKHKDGNESSFTNEYSNYHKYRGQSMKPSSGLVLIAIVIYIIAVCFNITIVQRISTEEYLNKNSTAIVIEVASRLGLGQSIEILGNVLSSGGRSTIWDDPRVLRESINVLYDWNAPIKLSPILSVSKEAGWLLFKIKLGIINNAYTINKSSLNNYAYVSSESLNVRSGPSTNDRIVTTLKMNTRVQIITKSGTWWKIKYENLEGYVNSQYLSDKIIPVNNVRSTSTNSISTTRDPEFQRANREAAEREKARGELPMGLVLPSGRTVEEELRMGNQYRSDR